LKTAQQCCPTATTSAVPVSFAIAGFHERICRSGPTEKMPSDDDPSTSLNVRCSACTASNSWS
jgi:hypothetical protein